jgi:hypothetical protein
MAELKFVVEAVRATADARTVELSCVGATGHRGRSLEAFLTRELAGLLGASAGSPKSLRFTTDLPLQPGAKFTLKLAVAGPPPKRPPGKSRAAEKPRPPSRRGR